VLRTGFALKISTQNSVSEIVRSREADSKMGKITAYF
jgi:hypothetical protein